MDVATVVVASDARKFAIIPVAVAVDAAATVVNQ